MWPSKPARQATAMAFFQRWRGVGGLVPVARRVLVLLSRVKPGGRDWRISGVRPVRERGVVRVRNWASRRAWVQRVEGSMGFGSL